MEFQLVYLFIALLPPILFAISNLIDSKLMRDYSAGPLMAISGVFNLIVASILGIYLFFAHIDIDWFTIGFLIVNSIFYIAGTWIYLNVLQTEEPSRAVPFFQSIPVYGLIGAYFLLGEQLGLWKIIGIGVLILGGLMLSIKDGVVKKRMAAMMLLSALLISVNDVVFAHFGRELTVAVALFGDILGKAVFGLGILLRDKFRAEFWFGLRNKFTLQSINELIFILGDLIFDWAKILAPVAIVQSLASTQPLFLLIIVIIATKYFPSIHSEDFSGISKWKKIFGVCAMVMGGILVSI